MAAGSLFEAWQRALAAECRVAHLGTIAADGRPHLVPICYVVLGDMVVTPVDEKPKRGRALARLANIQRDPRVTVLFDRYADDWTRLAWVRVEGTANIVPAGSQRPDALAALRDRYAQYVAMELEALPLIEVRARRVTGWRWSEERA